MNMQRTYQLRQSIGEEERKLEASMQAVVMPQCADDNEMASCYESTHTQILLMQHVQKRLQDLARNMAAIEGQSRALCLDCGETIPARRLAAVSDAVRCIGCQEEWERAAADAVFTQ